MLSCYTACKTFTVMGGKNKPFRVRKIQLHNNKSLEKKIPASFVWNIQHLRLDVLCSMRKSSLCLQKL